MATEILRPNANGDVTQLIKSGGSYNWEMVDEETQDGDSTYNYWASQGSYTKYDLYNLPAHSAGVSIINKITLYYCLKKRYSDSSVNLWGKIKTGGTEYQTDSHTGLSTSYATFSKEWATNPKTEVAWTWDDIDALQIGAGANWSTDVTAGVYVTQVYVEVDYTTISTPTVTTQAASDVGATGCTGNGNITDTGGVNCTRRGFCYKVGTSGDPTTSDAVAYDDGSFGTGAYTKAITGLSSGTSYRVRAYAVNIADTGYGSTVQILTKPAPPTNVAATKGTHADKVVITWTKSTGATGYRVYRNGDDISGLLGDVATYDDEDAPDLTINTGTPAATGGTYSKFVELSLTGQAINLDDLEYTVVAYNATGASAASASDTGYKTVGTLAYQWQRSAADSNADYSNISLAIMPIYQDYGAPVYPAGRYYKCALSASGCTSAATAAVRGYRKSLLSPRNRVMIVIKSPAGVVLHILKDLAQPGWDYRINEMGTMQFTLPANTPAIDDLEFPNEAWLFIDGVFKNKFKIMDTRRMDG